MNFVHRTFANLLLLHALSSLMCLAETVRAQDTSQSSLTQELLDVYAQRCRSEIEVLAARLDQRNAAVLDKLPKTSGQSVVESVRLAWAFRDEVTGTFQRLEESPRKFTRWANEAGLPAWFQLSDSLAQIRRWEAIRPILAPVAGGDRLGWDLPDTDTWKRSPGAWRFELLLLLQWFGRNSPALDVNSKNQALAWVREQTGADFVRRWRAGEADSVAFLHAEYKYDLLHRPTGDQLGLLPPRLASALGHVCWPRNGSLIDFVTDKDSLLIDLLSDIEVTAGSNVVEVDWYDAAARSFPPLLAFQPEPAADGAVRALLSRSNPSLLQTVGRMNRLEMAEATRSMLNRSILWYQAYLTPAGSLTGPVAGWSSWVQDQGSVATTAPDHFVSRITSGSGPDAIWSRVCMWILEEIGKRGDARPVHFSVRDGSGWVLAFGEGELKETASRLRKPMHFAENDRSGGLNVVLRVVAVQPDRGITVRLEMDDRVVSEQSFDVVGPWPVWFAARKRPSVASLWTYTSLILLGLAAWFLLTKPFAEHGPSRRLVSGCFIAGVAITAVMVLEWPIPSPAQELGGVVEFSLPLHAGMPSAIRSFLHRVSVEVYTKLADLAVDEKRPQQQMTWVQRWRYAIGSAFSERAGQRVGQTRGFAQLQYRVVPAAWPGNSQIHVGRIHKSEIDRFSRALDSIAYEGEPDLPLSLKYGPPPGTRLVLNLSDGDQGSLLPPPEVVWGERKTTVLSVFLPSPTRDSRTEHRLTLNDRRAWISRRSTETWSLLEGYPHSLSNALPALTRNADSSAVSPSDLESMRQSWWSYATRDDHLVGQAASEIADKALNLAPGLGVPEAVASHTVLGLRTGWQRLLPLAPVVLLGIPYWLLMPGVPRRRPQRVIVLFVVSVVVPSAILLFFVSAFAATVSPFTWSYGESLLDAIRPPLWLPVCAAMLTIVARIFFWFLSAWYPSAYDEIISSRAPDVDLGSLLTWLRRSVGLVGISVALVFWFSAPVRDIGGWRWWPPDYVSSMLAGLDLWTIGIFLLFCVQRAQRGLKNASFLGKSQ